MQKTMKKLLSIILAILMIVTTIPMAFAADTVASEAFGENGNNLTWTLDTEGVLTISGEGGMGTIDYGSQPWNAYKDEIKHVVIEEGVTDVGAYAFYQYSNLLSAYIANSVKIINDCAFRECSSATKIFIGSGVEMMTYYCFYNTNCVVHYNGTSAMWYAIDEDYNGKPWSTVHYLTVGSKDATCADDGYTDACVCSSCDAVFGGVIIPATGEHTRVNDVCTVCGDGCTHPTWTNAFCDVCGDLCVHPSYTDSLCDLCKTACSHEYKNGICTLCSYKCEHNFYYGSCENCGIAGGECTDTIVWTLDDDGVFTLSGSGDMPYYDYYRDVPWFDDLRDYIKTVIVSEGITSICDSAFYMCSNLTFVTLPDTLNKIDGGAFCDCSSLEDIIIPSGVTTLDASAFAWCGSLKTIHYLGSENELTIDETNNTLNEGILHFCEHETGVEASCTANGFADGWYCAECDKHIKVSEVIPATNHKDTLVQVDAKAPTCTQVGNEAYEYCTACDYTTKVEIPVDADAHDWSNKDGICARENCGYECVHANYADGACDNCDVKQKYTVRMETKLSKGVEFVGNPVAIHGEDLIIEFKNLVSEKCNDVSLFELTIGANSFYEFEFDENGITFDGTVLTIPGELVNGDVETHANAYTQARIKLNGGKFSPECPPYIVEEYFIENDYAISNKMLVGYNNSVKDTFVKDKHTIKSILASDGNDYNKIYYFSPNSDLEMTIEWECLPENFENGVCVECGYECPHEWSEGVLTRPTKTEEGYYTYSCEGCGDTKTEIVERADYSAYNEALEKVKGYLDDESLTDYVKEEALKVVNFFELDEHYWFIKGEDNVVAERAAQIKDFIDFVEEGIADGTAVKVDGFTVYNERGREWLLKFADEGIFEKARELILNSTEVKAKMDEIYDFALSLEGNVAENAENIAKIEADVDEFFCQLKKCVYGIHNVSQYKEISPAKCGENAVESATCTLCGETVTREVENSALKHSFTKYEVTEEAKCGVEGKEVAYCDNGCGETDEKAIAALTHKDADGDYICDHGCGYEYEKPAEPTPEAPEDTESEVCEDCGKVHDGFFAELICFFTRIINFIKNLFA